MTGGAFAAASLMTANEGWADPVGAPKTAKITESGGEKLVHGSGGMELLRAA